MDGFREYPTEFDLPEADEVAQPYDVAAAIGTDERRLHVRAYNHWVSLLRGRDFPSIEDLEPDDVEDFATHSVLLDFTCGHDNPAIPYVGSAIREECGLDDDIRTIGDVPSRSLLSRLTDHYMQIIANRSPVGFEAEFDNPAGETICYRGILMPFSSDGDGIDFIYGVINWKHVDEAAAPRPIADAVESFDEDEPEAAAEPVAAEQAAEPSSPLEVQAVEADEPVRERDPLLLEEGIVLPEVVLDENAGLADRLWAARETAETVKAGEGRTRAALYDALSLAYDFALAANDHQEDYAELLEESGVKAQARAPMTPIVKLVFGIDYDKARLTEFAAALSFAQRSAVDFGGFKPFLTAQAGGLKGLVAAERLARRPLRDGEDRAEKARDTLRAAPVLSLASLPEDEEFALVVTRRGPDGVHQPVAIVDEPALVERAIRRAV